MESLMIFVLGALSALGIFCLGFSFVSVLKMKKTIKNYETEIEKIYNSIKENERIISDHVNDVEKNLSEWAVFIRGQPVEIFFIVCDYQIACKMRHPTKCSQKLKGSSSSTAHIQQWMNYMMNSRCASAYSVARRLSIMAM